MLDVWRLNPPPAGFGRCAGCAYRDFGTAAICFACASDQMEPLAEDRCLTCDLELKADGECGNPVCGYPESTRGFRYIYAIAMMSGALQKAIYRYKYDGVKAWASIFGRVLAGYLEEDPEAFARFEVIAPSPTYVGEDGRGWDHIEIILRHAAEEAEGDLPFDLDTPHLIVQTEPVPRFVEQKNWQERRALAEGKLRKALEVPDPGRVRGRSILLFDDVFTDGLRTREVSLCLRGAGAAEVSQVVLARQPFRPRGSS